MSGSALPALIQRFFTDRLCMQLEASRHTVAARPARSVPGLRTARARLHLSETRGLDVSTLYRVRRPPGKGETDGAMLAPCLRGKGG